MTDFGSIECEAQRVIDGSGRMSLGKFKAVCNGWSKVFLYDDSAENDHFDDAATAHGKAMDWIGDRLADQIDQQDETDHEAERGDLLCHQRMDDELQERDQ